MVRDLLNKEVYLDPRILGLPQWEELCVFAVDGNRDPAFLHPGNNLQGLNCWLIDWPEQGTVAVVIISGEITELLAIEIIFAINTISLSRLIALKLALTSSAKIFL